MRITFVLILLIAIGNCKGQENNKDMDTFDKIAFDKNKVNGEYNFVARGGDLVRQVENVQRAEYSEQISNSVTPYSKVNLYFMSSGRLKIKGEKFYDMPIGVWKYYNESGEETKETNWEAPYKLTIDQLAMRMKAMDVDIMKRIKGVNVSRSANQSPKYSVAYPVGREHPYEIYVVYVDGTTGKVLEKTTSSVKH